MTDFSDLCRRLQVENLATIKETKGNHLMLVRALENAQFNPPQIKGNDFYMFFDVNDPSIDDRAHCRLFLPKPGPDLEVTRGDYLLLSVYVCFLN
jgi:hypothetical protein